MGSGTRDTFNEDIMGDKKAETPGVSTVAGSNAEIKTALTGSDKAIGYLGFSYAEDGSVDRVWVGAGIALLAFARWASIPTAAAQ